MSVEKIHKIGEYILMALGAVIIANAVIASFLSNMNTGILLTYALGAIFLLCGVFFKSIIKRVPKWVKCVISTGVLLVTIFVLFLFLYGSSNNVTYKEDAVIVLGAGIRGEELSENLKNRLDRAVDYHSKNPNAVIVVSGGQGPQEDITESLAMERYLLEQGLSEDKILKEENATSTKENFQYSKELLDGHFNAPYSTAFITSDYHIYRAESTAKLVGFESITHCHNSTPWYMILPNGLRECLAVVKLWILG